LLAFALLAHASHVPVVAALLAIAGSWSLKRPAARTPRAGLMMVAAALALSVAGNAVVMAVAKFMFDILARTAAAAHGGGDRGRLPASA